MRKKKVSTAVALVRSLIVVVFGLVFYVGLQCNVLLTEK